jgi:hypothetical protein
MEYSQNLMTPKLDDMLFSFIVCRTGLIETLEHFGCISHVEDVMTLGWGWEELFSHLIEKRNCSLSKCW